MMRLLIPFDHDGDPMIGENGVPIDTVTSFVAGPDGLTCYVQGRDGLYAGSSMRGKLMLEKVA